jgi:Zn-dependent protease
VFGRSWRVGRLFGIQIRIDPSWILIAALVTYNLYVRFGLRFVDLNSTSRLLLAIAVGILFFGSVLAHEMAHALTARRRGIEVEGITLFLFGGATHARVDSRRPRDELVVSIVGPLTSLVLGGLCLALAQPLGWPEKPIGWGFGYLGAVNILLAAFNMLPGFPLDGGRVLRAIVWKVTGSLTRATRIASIVGQGVGYAIIAVGVAWLLNDELGNAIWFAFIGWFLVQAARFSDRELRSRQAGDTAEGEDSEETDAEVKEGSEP